MDPYAKALKISITLHVSAAIAFCICILWNEIFKPRPASVFTVVAPPAGLLSGGTASAPKVAPSNVSPMPQGPKMPSPPAQEVTKNTPKATPQIAPQDDFIDVAPIKPKTVKKKTNDGTIKTKSEIKPQKMTYAEWKKKFGPKTNDKPKTKAKVAPANIAPSSMPSIEENLASRLDKRIQEEGDTPVGTGLGGAPGSGIAGNGIAGATDDADSIYSGTIYTYLNSVWEEPKEVGSVHLFARVEFVVNKAGEITGWLMTRKSGVDAFDRSVERVFAKIKQVTAPPTAQEYRLTVIFETRDS